METEDRHKSDYYQNGKTLVHSRKLLNKRVDCYPIALESKTVHWLFCNDNFLFL